MSQQSEIAFAHQDKRIELGHLLIGRVSRLWRQASVAALDSSWDALAPKMVQHVTAAQVAAANMATPYMDAIDRSYGNTAPPVSLVPEAFGGVMLDGREVGPAMFSAVTTTKQAIGGGMAPARAFEVGANALAVIVSTALQDMGRQADMTLGNARNYTSYVRVVGGSACSRCAVLAGIWSPETAFLRHASCCCTAAPINHEGKSKGQVPKGFHSSPDAYFESLSKAEQDRVFTNAGAEAIRNGADPVKVVNARRGAYGIGYNGHHQAPLPTATRNRLQQITIGVKPDGSPLKVFATTEGTTARGSFYKGESKLTQQAVKDGRYRRTTTVRVMPEQIVKMAGNNPDRFRELLQKYGYID